MSGISTLLRRLEYERYQHPFETPGIERAHFHGDGKQQNAGDHGEQRNAGTNEASPENGGFKVKGAVKTADERITAMGQYNKEAGQDTQEVDPCDVAALRV